jgi:hypothetical protein
MMLSKLSKRDFKVIEEALLFTINCLGREEVSLKGECERVLLLLEDER